MKERRKEQESVFYGFAGAVQADGVLSETTGTVHTQHSPQSIKDDRMILHFHLIGFFRNLFGCCQSLGRFIYMYIPPVSAVVRRLGTGKNVLKTGRASGGRVFRYPR